MWQSHIYWSHAYRRVEKGQRRIPHPLAPRGRGATWIRDLETHRDAIGWRAHLSRRLALSPALPDGRARLDRRSMGRTRRAATQTLLLDHQRRSRDTRRPAQELARVRRRDRQRREGEKCVTGEPKSAAG